MSLCNSIVEDLKIRIRNLTVATVKEKGPEHAHVVQQEEPKTPGESTKVKCMYCEPVFTTTTTRIRAHLLRWIGFGVRACDKVPLVVTHQFEELEKEKKENEFKKRKVEQLDKLSSGEAIKPKKQNTLKAAFSKQDCSKVDQLWGRAFYANGLSFHLVKDPHFKVAVAATASFGESYPGPPSVDRLRTTILEHEKQLCWDGLASFQESLQLTRATITSDGWSNVRRHPLLNLLVVSPKGEMFL
jgi:hypothetical protein